MAGNRRRNANAVPLAMMASWIMVCLTAGVAGLGYVWMKNQLHTSSGSIKALEKELAALSKQNEVVELRIIQASSRSELLKRWKNDKTHFNGLIDIPQDKLVFIGRPQPGLVESRSEDDIQKVTNRELAR